MSRIAPPRPGPPRLERLSLEAEPSAADSRPSDEAPLGPVTWATPSSARGLGAALFGFLRPAVTAVLAGSLFLGACDVPRVHAETAAPHAIAAIAVAPLGAPPAAPTVDASAVLPAGLVEAGLDGLQRIVPTDATRAERRLARLDSQFFRFHYPSGGETIGAILAVPPGFDATLDYPVVIYNRGGNSDFGAMGAQHLLDVHDYFLAQGYVVVAAQHRGTDVNEGADQFGGPKDVQATLDLVDTARGIPFVDRDRSFMGGHSRGGMTTYLALKAGAPVKGAVVLAGVADLVSWPAERRASLGDDLEAGIYARHVPGWASADATERQRLLESRSAVAWADAIDVPVLVVHGTADERVAPEQAARLVSAVRAAGGHAEHVVLPGADHGLAGFEPEVGRRIDAFFDARLAPER